MAAFPGKDVRKGVESVDSQQSAESVATKKAMEALMK